MTSGFPASQTDTPSRSTTSLAATVLATATLVALLVLLFSYVLSDLAHDWWTEPELSQGMLIPPLAALTVWAERKRLMLVPAATDPFGLVLLAFGCGIYLLGRLASEFFLMRLSFVVVLTGLIWTFWGRRRLRQLTFPILLLTTMIPLPAVVYNTLAAPLQLFASEFATAVAQALGVSAFRDGNIIQLANISLGVAEACSGLSCLSALLIGSLLLGYLLDLGTSGRILLVVLAVPLAILVNVVRVAGTALLADYNERLALGFYHAFSGWLVFVGGSLALYVLASVIRKLTLWSDNHAA